MRLASPDPASKLHWEDFIPGRIFTYGPRRITREEILDFAREFDPQPFHIDDEAARHTMLGGLCASGWHSCSIAMRMMADAFLVNSTSMGSPGVEEVRWLLPIRPDDDLNLRVTVLATRTSNSRPDMGFVTFELALFNVSGKCAMTIKAPLMFSRRSPGKSAA
jgi:acyl dehydratase